MRRDGRQIPLLLIAMILASAASHAQTPSPPTPQARRSQPTVASPVPLAVRIEAIPIVELKSTPSGLSPKDFAPSLGAVIGLIGALVAVWMSGRTNKQTVEMAQRNNQASIEAAQRNNQAGIEAAQRNAEVSIMAAQRNNEASLWQKANETELKDIQAKLDGFYGPFLQLSGMNGLMALEFRDRQPDKDTFRLLKSVFDKQWLASLSEGDKIIVREICNNASILEGFLKDKAAMVDVKVLPYLSRASAHFRVLRLAYKGELGTDPDNFLRYVYPWQLDKVLELEVERLQRRSNLLRAHPGNSPGSLELLTIPPELDLPDWPSPERRPILWSNRKCEASLSPPNVRGPTRL